MTYEDLRTFLPAFLTVFILALSAWAWLVKRKNNRIISPSAQYQKEFLKIKQIDFSFRILLVVYAIIVILYSLFPKYYKALVLPIEWLDHPFINNMGVLILKISLAALIVAQLNIDRTLFKINQGMEDWHYLKLLTYSERILLFSMLMMFIGVFVTISSLMSIALCAIAGVLFIKLNRSPTKTKMDG